MHTTSRFRFVLVAGVSLLMMTGFALGSMLNPGDTAYAVGEAEPVGGAVVAGPLVLNFGAGQYSGTLISTVISGDTSNTLGGLTFVYELINDAKSIDSIGRLTINGFAGSQTDASYGLPVPALAQVPTLVDRSLSGNVVGFSFVGPPLGLGALLPGTASALLIVQTDAPQYVTSFASVIDGTVNTVGTYAPVPEPASLALLAIGLGLIVRRR